jgi:uncharacterized protein (UPF0548 family)
VADLDVNSSDGFPDLVTANLDGADVSVLLGNGDGTFQGASSFAVTSGPYSVAVDDLDVNSSDGFPDLVTANPFTNNVGVLLGNGDGTFQAASFDNISYLIGNPPRPKDPGPYSVAVANINVRFDPLDIPDLVTANFESDDVSVLLGNGDGTFPNATAGFTFPMGNGPRSVAVANLNVRLPGGDNFPDLVTANYLSNDVSVRLGFGGGAFGGQVRYAMGDSPYFVAVADLDVDSGDNFPDLVTANLRSNDVSVRLGFGGGGFQDEARYPAGNAPYFVAVADLDGDGLPDLVTANYNSNTVSVLLGNGDGTFQPASFFTVGDGPVSLAVADLDFDSPDDFPDLVTANIHGDDVSVLLNQIMNQLLNQN